MKPKIYVNMWLVITVLFVRCDNWRVCSGQLGRVYSSCVPDLLLVLCDTLQFVGAHYPSWWVGQNWLDLWYPCCDHMPAITFGEIWRVLFACKTSMHWAFYLRRHNCYCVTFKKFLAPWGAVSVWINREQNRNMTSHFLLNADSSAQFSYW
jgi:hypothetical protein